jgi:hypothetical protein
LGAAKKKVIIAYLEQNMKIFQTKNGGTFGQLKHVETNLHDPDWTPFGSFTNHQTCGALLVYYPRFITH